ncbi:hypothetical protein JXQ70_17410 [bacterium]|nr:hypothetical protein [bacterium]
MDKEQKCNKLMDQGLDALDSFNTKEAIKIGKKLKKLRQTSAFEILALAYHQDEKPDKSIEVLKEGLKVAPNVWVLWQLLGNYQSDSGNYDEAHKCYKMALGCEYKDESSIKYNSAIAYSRENKYADAENEIDSIDLDKLEYEKYYKLLILISSEKINILNNLNKLKESYSFGRAALGKEYDVDGYRDELASLYTAHAETLWLSNNNEKALEHLWYSIKLNKKHKRTGFLIREIENKFSKNAKYYRIMIEGIWSEPFEGETEKPGFFTSYDVVAENIEQAFELIKRFEPYYVQDSLKIKESEILEENSSDPIGIYSANSYIFFTE